MCVALIFMMGFADRLLLEISGYAGAGEDISVFEATGGLSTGSPLFSGQSIPTPRSGKGICYDSAAMETFLKTIKAELIWRHSWQTRRDVEIAIFEYINGFYNPRSRQSALGWKSLFSWIISQTNVRQRLAFERFVA